MVRSFKDTLDPFTNEQPQDQNFGRWIRHGDLWQYQTNFWDILNEEVANHMHIAPPTYDSRYTHLSHTAMMMAMRVLLARIEYLEKQINEKTDKQYEGLLVKIKTIESMMAKEPPPPLHRRHAGNAP